MTWDVTIATHAGAPRGAPDDLHLADRLHRAGASVRFAEWNGHGIDWSASPATLIRSTWDYHLQPQAWLAWIDSLEGVSRLVNAASLVRWNTDKRYLLELSRHGIAVVTTLVASGPESVDATFLAMEDRGWSDVVVKPSVGASAHGAARFGREAPVGAAKRHARTLAANGSVLIQPFQEGVVQERERSLVMIAGEFSHAFTKPAFDAGAAGGSPTTTRHDPSAEELKLATRVLAVLDEEPTYARVDMVPTASGPQLMELELIEPHLALAANPGSAEALARAVLSA